MSLYKNDWYQKFNEDFFHYTWKKFINKDSTICGIGSCFNSNFIKWLNLSGIKIIEPTWGYHYNPATILNELYKIFDKEKSNTLYWEIFEDNSIKLIDALRHPICAKNEKEFYNIDKQLSKNLKLAIKNSDVFLISFGLSEIWEQKIKNKWITINRTPPDAILNNKNYTFRHRNLSVLECKKYILNTIKLIQFFNHKIKIILINVPIPLKTSYRNMHPKISDIMSKSRLLIAVDEIIEKNISNIIYFPAYEIFEYPSEKDMLFQKDHRHLKAEAIDKIGKIFVDSFVNNDNFIKKNINFEVKQIII